MVPCQTQPAVSLPLKRLIGVPSLPATGSAGGMAVGTEVGAGAGAVPRRVAARRMSTALRRGMRFSERDDDKRTDAVPCPRFRFHLLNAGRGVVIRQVS